MEVMGVKGIFVMTASLPCITAFFSLLLKEEPAQPRKVSIARAVYHQIAGIAVAFRNPSVWKPALV